MRLWRRKERQQTDPFEAGEFGELLRAIMAIPASAWEVTEDEKYLTYEAVHNGVPLVLVLERDYALYRRISLEAGAFLSVDDVEYQLSFIGSRSRFDQVLHVWRSMRQRITDYEEEQRVAHEQKELRKLREKLSPRSGTDDKRDGVD